ncbi:uncharacterized protein I303_106567 [Kwoniella dejecticola CBS 10117]|uniref:UAS domain-containing protein n=1 Tax=Kwoniella dejecticola CBS 10117 TaxID=1296121 RepID=A0A1A5ZUC4_9TREE|nr:uncharacterized protein I303_08176 [Kwoniella dejecticola CBS 10117]OBR81406.1 hypothetical protein I303_08176 [Kwoniella dejecticola CBS 10117]
MSLSPSQQEALQQLLAVTASSTPAQKERDERLLRENGWNVQVTVEQIFSMGTAASDVPNDTTSASPSSSIRTSSSGTRPMMSRLEVDDHNPFLPRHPAGTRRLSGPTRPPRSPVGPGGNTANVGLGLWGLIVWPISIVWGIVGGIWYFIIRTFVPLSLLPRLPSFLLPPSSSSTSANLRRTEDPTTTSLRFIRDLETSTRCSASQGNLPDFYIGPYREFVQHLRKQGRLGLVVVVSGEHENDEEFKKSVLTDEELVRTLKEKDVVVWGADLSSREGYQVAQTLLLTTYPSLTFLSLLPVPNSSTPKLTILTTLSGSPSTTTSASNILQTLTTTILPRVTPFLNRLKRERLSLEEARHLREEQDKAFKEAERKDREKMQIQRQKEELERIQVQRKEREREEKQKYEQNRKIWRKYAKKHLVPTFFPEGKAGETDGVKVAIRTPLSSERHRKTFKRSTSTLSLFVFIDTLLADAEGAEGAGVVVDSPPEGFEDDKLENINWGFEIVTSFPRREIEATSVNGEEYWNIIKQSGGVLFVERKNGSGWGMKIKEGEEASDEEEIVSDSD